MKEKLGNRKVTIGTKSPRKGISCVGCAFLAFIQGMPPLCVAKASYVDGAIYRKIDVIGVVPAEEANKKRNCPNRKRFSFRARGLRRYL